MLDFLRLLSPRHGDALRPATPLRRMTGVMESGEGPAVPAQPDTAHSDASSKARPAHGPTAGVGPAKIMSPIDATDIHSDPDTTSALRATTTGEKPLRRASAEPGVVRPHRTRALPLPEASGSADHEVVDTPLVAPAHIPRVAPVTPAAPLSMSVMAQLPPERPASPPSIHISIDRIEVRAPRPAPSPAASAPRRAAPSQPLGDYLRGKAHRP